MKARYWVGLVVVVVVISVALMLRYLRVHASAVHPNIPQTVPATAPLIETAQPAMRTFALRVPWIGTVEAQTSVQLTALVAGRVEEIEAKDQAPVQVGEVIARLGGPQIETQRGQFQARVESLKSQLDIADQTVERLQRDLNEQLVTRDQLAAAQETQLQLRGQLRDVQLAQDSFEKQIELAAPIAGIFTSRRVSVGQALSVGDAIGEIIDTGHLRVVAKLFPPEGVALDGRNTSVLIGEEQSVPGTVQHVLPQTSSTGETIVWIGGPEIDQRLRLGQTVSGDVVVETNRSALAVPQSAIVFDSREQPLVFVRTGDTYKPLSVRLGLTEDGWVEVRSGLEQNQAVVTRGAYELFYRQFNEQFKVQD